MTEKLKRPDLTDIDPEVFAYIQYLEKINEGLGENGAVYLVSSLNDQMRVLADQVRTTEIDFTKTEDKIFDRFIQLVKLARDITGDFKSLLQEYGEVIKTEEPRAIPLVEQHAQNNK
jgi:hypothetical protein